MCSSRLWLIYPYWTLVTSQKTPSTHPHAYSHTFSQWVYSCLPYAKSFFYSETLKWISMFWLCYYLNYFLIKNSFIKNSKVFQRVYTSQWQFTLALSFEFGNKLPRKTRSSEMQYQIYIGQIVDFFPWCYLLTTVHDIGSKNGNVLQGFHQRINLQLKESSPPSQQKLCLIKKLKKPYKEKK